MSKSSDPFHIVSYHIKLVITSWTHGTMGLPVFSSSVWADSDQEEEEEVDEGYKDDEQDEGRERLSFRIMNWVSSSPKFYL